jgi:mono/diheme cytochrome c family protein
MPQKFLLPVISLSLAILVGLLFWQFQQAGNVQAQIVINNIAVHPLPTLDTKAVSQGQNLYQQFCATCHGTNLEGAPNWKLPLADGSLPPPPHDDSGHTWHHPDFLLLQIMSEGGKPLYDGVMPGFAAQLTQEDMRAILEFLKSHWSRKSREYQWWITNTYPTPTPSP